MKRIHPEDPRVTSHALGELPEQDGEDVHRAAQEDPAVQAAVEQTRTLGDMLRAGFQTESHELGEARREAIRRAGRRPMAENLVSMQPRRRDWVRPALVAGAAAALVACALWMMQQIPVGENSVVTEMGEEDMRDVVRMQILLAPPRRAMAGTRSLPVPPRADLFDSLEEVPQELVDEEYQALRELMQSDPDAFFRSVQEVARSAAIPVLATIPLLPDNPFLPARDASRSTVPLVSGTASYHLVERFIRTEKKLPPRNSVRTEELINQVGYEDPDDPALDGVHLGVELVRCPWDEDTILMGVLLFNGSDEEIARDAMLQVEVKPDHIRSYRLIGYAGAPGRDDEQGADPPGLAPGDSNFVLYQLQPLDSELFRAHRVLARAGLKLGVEEPRGLIVPVTSPPRDWVNASNNLQTAVSLGGWGMLLRKSPFSGQLSVGTLGTLAQDALRGSETDDLPRREALQLVIDSLPLLEAASVEAEP